MADIFGGFLQGRQSKEQGAIRGEQLKGLMSENLRQESQARKRERLTGLLQKGMAAPAAQQPAIEQQIFAEDPDLGAKVREFRTANEAQQSEKVAGIASSAYRALGTPDEGQALAWMAQAAEDAGEDPQNIGNAMQQYAKIQDPAQRTQYATNLVQGLMSRGMGAKDFLSTTKPDKPGKGTLKEVMIGGKPSVVRIMDDGTAVPIAGVTPMPKGKTSLSVNPETGEITFEQGVGAGGVQEPVKSMVTALQKGLEADYGNLDKVNDIIGQYKPEFLTYKGRGEAFFAELKDKAQGLGIGEITPNQKEMLQNRTNFVQSINKLFNSYRKEITGAAASVQELESLKKAMLNEDLSPSQFEAVSVKFRSELQRSVRLRRKLLREGFDTRKKLSTELDRQFTSGFDDDPLVRGEEIEAELIAKGYEQDAIDAMVEARMEKEGFE